MARNHPNHLLRGILLVIYFKHDIPGVVLGYGNRIGPFLVLYFGRTIGLAEQTKGMTNRVLGIPLHGIRIGNDDSFLRICDDGRKYVLTPVVTEFLVRFLGEEARLAGSVPYRQSNTVPG